MADLQSALKVTAIMTPRDAFVCAPPEKRAADRCASNQQGFDHFPVIRRGHTEDVIGIFNAHAWSAAEQENRTVGDVMEPLAERHLLDAGTPILEFLRAAGERPFRFLVDGGRIAGLVTLSDIQRLPVRVALFALITDLEQAMADLISRRGGGFAERGRFLSEERRQKLHRELKKAWKNSEIVEEIFFTIFHDKQQILKGMNIAVGDAKEFADDLDLIRELRNHIAHANAYAPTRGKARSVCALVARIEGIPNGQKALSGQG